MQALHKHDKQEELVLRATRQAQNRSADRELATVSVAVKYAKAAILCPEEFDNYLFWHLVYKDVKDDIQAIQDAACVVGMKLESRRYPDTFFPYLTELLPAMVARCHNPNKIIGIIKQCAHVKSSGLDWMDDFLRHDVQHGNNQPSIPPWVSAGPNGPDVPPVFLGREEAAAGLAPSPSPSGPRPLSNSLSLRILAGFLTVLGAVAIVVAFAALHAAALQATGLIVAGLGVASVLAGVGLFRHANASNNAVPTPSLLSRFTG